MNIILHTIYLFLRGALPILIPTFIFAWILKTQFQNAKTREKTREAIQEARLRFIKAYIRFKKHQKQFESLGLPERGYDTFENHPETSPLKQELDKAFANLKNLKP